MNTILDINGKVVGPGDLVLYTTLANGMLCKGIVGKVSKTHLSIYDYQDTPEGYKLLYHTTIPIRRRVYDRFVQKTMNIMLIQTKVSLTNAKIEEKLVKTR